MSQPPRYDRDPYDWMSYSGYKKFIPPSNQRARDRVNLFDFKAARSSDEVARRLSVAKQMGRVHKPSDSKFNPLVSVQIRARRVGMSGQELHDFREAARARRFNRPPVAYVPPIISEYDSDEELVKEFLGDPVVNRFFAH